jgi:hypothetical protein
VVCHSPALMDVRDWLDMLLTEHHEHGDSSEAPSERPILEGPQRDEVAAPRQVLPRRLDTTWYLKREDQSCLH